MSHNKLKLKVDYNDSNVLEVEYLTGKWARVTSNHFRSCTGNRRVNGIKYIGPIYYEGTNYIYHKADNDEFKIVSIEELNSKKKARKVKVSKQQNIGVTGRL